MNKAACRNNLYRIPARGKIFGVCAGIAAYFGWQPWKVRLITVIAALFTGLWLVVVGYLVAFFILEPEPRPEQRKQPVNQPRTRFNDRVEEVKQAFHKSSESSEAIISMAELENQLNAIRTRVELAEAHVTSGRFQLEREFKTITPN